MAVGVAAWVNADRRRVTSDDWESVARPACLFCALSPARLGPRDANGEVRASYRHGPPRSYQSVRRRSARVLQACRDARDGAQDEVGVALPLAVAELLLVHLLAQRLEGEHLGEREHVHVRGADAHDAAEHVAVLQRPLVSDDGELSFVK